MPILSSPWFGSSPRGRGTRTHIDGYPLVNRFIPAWAGNTRGRTRRRQPHAVHPRVGGEHNTCNRSLPLTVGSSPRGRGTRGAGVRPGLLGRFIPAWAGNTGADCTACAESAVHPRVGGEHSNWPSISTASPGSSPRGRGTQLVADSDEIIFRFIPAWAGNTLSTSRSMTLRPVHPRVGGEHLFVGYCFRRRISSLQNLPAILHSGPGQELSG